MATPTCVHPTPEELLPIFRACFTRATIKRFLRSTAPNPRFYWRVFTPLVLLWCLILQRLQHDHSADAVVCHLHTGAADALDPDDPHLQSLSQRLRSESTSAYAQGRARLPLSLIQAVNHHLIQTVQAWVAATPTPPTWKGHAVRLFDGTTFRLAPTPDLVATYGQSRNQHGDGYWVIVRSVASFCLYTQQCCGMAEARTSISESAMTRAVLEADPPNTVFVGDSNFGVYRVAQVARALLQHVVLRRQAAQARALLRATGYRGPIAPGLDWPVQWACSADTQVDPTLPHEPLPGRVIFVRLSKAGFRPMELYLFTSLTDAAAYPVDDLVALYGVRWQVEISYRHIKTAMEMDEFTAQTAEMFRKELAAGLLTYNLICATLVMAAQRAQVRPNQLSFQHGLRRVRAALLTGVPAWVQQTGALATYLLDRLGKCRLQQQPLKIQHEPRQVRRRPQVFPALKGDRNIARQQVLKKLGQVATPAPGEPDVEASKRHKAQQKAA